MIKSFEVLLPKDFPYTLISFKFYFETYNTPIMNLYHAAGMNLLYEHIRICHLFPQNEFYQLSELRNTDEPHDEKYNLILMKGICDKGPKVPLDIDIENGELLDILRPGSQFNKHRLRLDRLPKPADDLLISDERPGLFHHFSCGEVFKALPNGVPCVRLVYVTSVNDPLDVVRSWFADRDTPAPL